MDVFEVAQKLSGATLGTMLILILVGGWKRVWVWGYQLVDKGTEMAELKAEHGARLAALERDRDEWKGAALSATGLAKGMGELARRTQP